MKLNNTLAGLGFGNILAEQECSTATGRELMARYQAYLMNNAESVNLVNNFIKEAKNCLYDKGIQAAVNEIGNYLSENKVSWQLATVVENIENDNHTWNFLNKGAVNQVRSLLEMNEEDVVKYIKAGVLKNCMFVESIRNVVKSVFNDRPIREQYSNYSATHPFSLMESNNGTNYICICNKVYKMDNEKNISEASINEVSTGFKMMMSFINSNKMQFENDSLIYNAGAVKYIISESGKVVKETVDGKKTELTVEQFRDNANTVLKSNFSMNRNQLAGELEMVAQISENFDNFFILDNVSVISSRNEQFVVIESNTNSTNAIVESINSVHPFRIEGNIMECVSYVKKRCNIDLTEKYQDGIRQVVENEEHETKMKMEMEITESAVEDRRKKINEMIERYKNDPAKLAVLSKCALALNELA